MQQTTSCLQKTVANSYLSKERYTQNCTPLHAVGEYPGFSQPGYSTPAHTATPPPAMVFSAPYPLKQNQHAN